MDPLTKKEADSVSTLAVKVSDVSATKPDPLVTPVPIPGLLFGSEGPTVTQTGKAEVSEWERVWQSSIDDYFEEQLAGKAIKGLAQTYPEFPGVFARLRQDLIDPKKSAAECRKRLEEVRAACRKKGAHENASSFPTGTQTNMLEFVNVKLMWQSGDRTLLPGVAVTTMNKTKATSTMFPDYATASEEVVGDHVRVAKPTATREKVLEFIADDVKDKLTTYPAKKVHVLVDVIPSTIGAKALAGESEARKAIIAALKEGIPGTILARLARVDVVLADDVLVTIEQKDLL